MFETYQLEKDRDYGDYGYGDFRMNLTADQVSRLRRDFPKAKFVLEIDPRYDQQIGKDSFAKYGYTPSEMLSNLQTYPKDIYHGNNITNFEKITIPKKGTTHQPVDQ